jgi:hypothetical protein
VLSGIDNQCLGRDSAVAILHNMETTCALPVKPHFVRAMGEHLLTKPSEPQSTAMPHSHTPAVEREFTVNSPAGQDTKKAVTCLVSIVYRWTWATSSSCPQVLPDLPAASAHLPDFRALRSSPAPASTAQLSGRWNTHCCLCMASVLSLTSTMAGNIQVRRKLDNKVWTNSRHTTTSLPI